MYRVGLALRANLAASRGLRPRVGARLRLALLTKKGAAKPRPYLEKVVEPQFGQCSGFAR